MYLVLVDAMDRSEVMKIQKYNVIFVYILQGKMGKTKKAERKSRNLMIFPLHQLKPKTKTQKLKPKIIFW
jgi:hypothetical protein